MLLAKKTERRCLKNFQERLPRGIARGSLLTRAFVLPVLARDQPKGNAGFLVDRKGISKKIRVYLLLHTR